MRTYEDRIRIAEQNVKLQKETLTLAEARFHGGTTGELDVFQARSTLEQTEAQIPELRISLRQASTNSAFCWACRRKNCE